MRVEVIREHTDNHRTVYEFYVSTDGNDTISVRLARYNEEHRSTKRHKWTIVRYYYYLTTRDCTIKDPATITLPADVYKEVMGIINARIVFSVYSK